MASRLRRCCLSGFGLLALGCAGGPASAHDGGNPAAGRPAATTPPREPARTGDAAAAAAAAPDDVAARDVVAEVDGQPIRAAEAFRLLFLSAENETGKALRQLVLDRLAAIEAAVQGVTVPPAVVERELARVLGESERKIQEASKGAQDLASYVAMTWQLDRPGYAALVRASLTRSLLLERVVLMELSHHPRTQLRLIRVKERALAEEIRKKLGQNADFGTLARQHSEDLSAREGGIYPPLPTDLDASLLEKTGELESGELSPVEEISTPDGPRYRIVQVLGRLPAETGNWNERAASIEQVLESRPVAPLELEAWMRIMEQRHVIRLHGLGKDGAGTATGRGIDSNGS